MHVMTPHDTPNGRVTVWWILLLAACRTTTPGNVSTPIASVTPVGSEAFTASSGDVLVRAREAPQMPTCEATDALAIAPLSPATPAYPTLARTPQGGLVAYITDPQGDGATQLNLLALDAQGSPARTNDRGSEVVVLSDTGLTPNVPSLAATAQGYLLAWRQGPVGQQRIMVRTLDARGVPSGETRAVGTAGWLGAPTLKVFDGRWSVAVVRAVNRAPGVGRDGGAWGTHLDLSDAEGTRSVAAPAGAGFDGDAPLLVRSPAGVRVYATVARRQATLGDERALVRLFDDAQNPITLVARDLDHPAALALDGAALLAWRTRLTRHETAMRTVLVPFDGEASATPITVATYRGAFDARVALVALGTRDRPLLGALTVSTLADNAAGSLNVSLLERDGSYVGRAPIVTGFPTRATAFAVAEAPPAASDDSAWIAVDGREADGPNASLLVTRVQCDPRRPVERLDVPPSTFEQDLTPPDDASIRLARELREMPCAVRASGTFTTHQSGRDDLLADTESAVVVTPAGAVLLAITRQGAHTRSKLMFSTLDAQGRSTTARPIVDGATRLLAAEATPNAALAVVTVAQPRGAETMELVVLRGATVTRTVVPGLREATSAAVAPESGLVFVVAREPSGDTVLARVTLTAGRAVVNVLTTLRPGDRVLDAAREGVETHALVARPDPMGEELGQSLARIAASERRSAIRDPFADPISHARDAAIFTYVGTSLGLAYNERNVLRVGAITHGQVHDARSLVETLPGGGAVRSSAWGAPRTRWIALATGNVDASRAHLRGVTIAALDDHGDVRGITARLPEDPDAVADGMALGARGGRVVILHAHVEQRGVSWRWVDATCTLQGGTP